jgi:DNA-binding MarR family transcriptional regulator
MSRNHRAALIAALTDQMRDSATRAVMLHQAIAERFGLNSTDLKCLDLARNERQLTAGRLAELTGMSTSAITTVLDRLERAGVIERTADPADRRKVIVTPTDRHEEARAAVFTELGERFGAVLGDYDDRQLELMTEFLRRLNAVSYDLTLSLPGRADADHAGAGRAGADR